MLLLLQTNKQKQATLSLDYSKEYTQVWFRYEKTILPVFNSSPDKEWIVLINVLERGLKSKGGLWGAIQIVGSTVVKMAQ